jgi:hypothetical protein
MIIIINIFISQNKTSKFINLKLIYSAFISILEYFPKNIFGWMGELEPDYKEYYLVFLVESLVVSSMRLDAKFH